VKTNLLVACCIAIGFTSFTAAATESYEKEAACLVAICSTDIVCRSNPKEFSTEFWMSSMSLWDDSGTIDGMHPLSHNEIIFTKAGAYAIDVSQLPVRPGRTTSSVALVTGVAGLRGPLYIEWSSSRDSSVSVSDIWSVERKNKAAVATSEIAALNIVRLDYPAALSTVSLYSDRTGNKVKDLVLTHPYMFIQEVITSRLSEEVSKSAYGLFNQYSTVEYSAEAKKKWLDDSVAEIKVLQACEQVPRPKIQEEASHFIKATQKLVEEVVVDKGQSKGQ
jgi:hypothetical protein